jgi:formylglycine-generating enzyme required for sulfatase activity
LQWLAQAGGLVNIGCSDSNSESGDGPFAFDNEGPRHPHWLQPHALANRLVTQGEWLAFV